MTINDQKRQAAIEFGKDRGWKLSDAPFDLETLAPRRCHPCHHDKPVIGRI